jgi:type IVB pilus formation R64 PilN family outer membrane protein
MFTPIVYLTGVITMLEPSTISKLTAISIAILLGGCAAVEKNERRVSTVTAESMKRIETAKAQSDEQLEIKKAASSARERVESPYFSVDGAKPVPTARPKALDKIVEISVVEATSLSSFVSTLSDMIGLTIRLDADVGEEAGKPNLRPNFTGRAEDGIKQIAGSLGLSTRIEDGAMVIFRFETAVFRSKRTVGKFNTVSSIGVSSNASTSGGQAASGNSNLSSSVQGDATFDPWRELGDSIKASLTPQGKVAIMQSSGTIVVTDTPLGVRRAERIIDTDNRLATHPILVKMEIVSLQDDNNNDFGVNWTDIFARISTGNSALKFAFSSPPALAQGSVGSFKVDLGGVQGQSSNSDLLISALAETGKTSTVFRREFTSLHNIPASIARTASTSYRARVTASGASSATGATEPGVEPGSVTTGTKLFITPTWVGNDDYVVTVTYDDSFLKALRPLGVGKQQIDAPETESTQTFNVAQIKTGYTAVLNAMEIDQDSIQSRGLTEAMTTGKSGSGKKLRFFMLLTVAQGPY